MNESLNSRVSIIVPLFNRQDLIKATIDSVVAQTNDQWELLIIDDHSSDRSLDAAKLKAESDPRIRVWKRSGESKGAPTCRNEGLQAANGEFVIFLDSDDLLGPECVEKRIDAFESFPDFDFQLFPSEQFRYQPGDLGIPWFRHADDSLTGFMKQPLWQTTAAIWKTESIRALGGFREDLLSWQDWDLFVRALIIGQKYSVHSNAEPDNFIRRSTHDRISLHAARAKNCLRNRTALFRDLHRDLKNANLLTETRVVALRDLFIKLATQMHIARMSGEANEWIEELSKFGLIENDQVTETQRVARENSRLTFQQKVNELKVTILRFVRRLPGLKR